MAADFQHPIEECDLVMKGGITSGIVYPPAVLRLATKYRFRCIGGTSAGAIAAGATAAAEYGRETGGFEKLKQVSDELGEGTFLRDLFQPSRETAPLMNTLFAVKESADGLKGWRALTRVFFGLNLILLRETTLAFVLGAAVGVGVSLLLVWLTGGSLQGKGLVLLVFLGWSGALVSSALRLVVILLKELPRNSYGLCKGLKDPSGLGGRRAVLTDWLSSSIQRIAGREIAGAPLTFGELDEKQVHVKMMTSNLSQNLPYELPFEKRNFVFKEEELKDLFPENVLKHLKCKSYGSAIEPQRQAPESPRVVLPNGYYFLPEGKDLPLAFAMRLSLSFPVLISAVPLYTINLKAFKEGRGNALTENDLQRNLFSDGGIASNFPIHFFDSWLPTRPTFGITLVSLPDDAFAKGLAAEQSNPKYISAFPADGSQDTSRELRDVVVPESVFLPKANRPQNPDWKPLESLFQFLWSIFATAQNYRDNTQAMLPSYRERVAQIRLSDSEGGLNLAMSSETIKAVKEKGARAGEVFLKDFRLDQHQWVRFLVLMGLLESNLRQMETVLKDGSFPLETIMDAQLNKDQKFPYPRNASWRAKALSRITELEELVHDWSIHFFDKDIPKPTAVLRVVPKV